MSEADTVFGKIIAKVWRDPACSAGESHMAVAV